VSDTTFIAARQGWLYLAIVIGLYSRKVVGGSMSASNHAQLVCDALSMAITNRKPKADLLHHSDQGITYTSNVYRNLLNQYQITSSMSRKGNCYDNAVAERFFGNLKNELTYHHASKTRQEAKSSIFDYIECFYTPRARSNRKRLHQTLNYHFPVEYEMMQAVA